MNTTCGTAAWSAVATCSPHGAVSTGPPAARAPIAAPTIRASYLPWWVSGARPVTSPAAYSHSPSTPCTSPVSSTVSGSRLEADRLQPEVVDVRPAPGGDQQLVDDQGLRPDVQRDRRRPSGATESSPVPSRTSTPSRRSAAATFSDATGSADGSSRGPRTSSTTSEPSRRQACASSQPTTPPPSTPSRRGTACADVASRLVHVRTESRPGIGGRTGRLPVRDDDGVPRAEHLADRPRRRRSPASRARPRTTGIPAPSAHSTWLASSQPWVIASRRFSTAPTSNSAVTPGSRRAATTASAVRSSALLGMHAQYEHSPPTSSDSTSAVESPPRCA